MKVFISWSGEMSRRVALALYGWLPDVLNEIEPWMSEQDIDKGAVGLAELASALSNSSFGIVCLTQENQHRDWVNFEAGAIAKSVGVERSRVATLLIDQAGPSEVTGPLAQFQATSLDLADMTKLVRSLNKVAAASRPDEAIDRVVGNLWPALEQSILEARKSLPDTTPAKPRRKDRDLLEEILTLTRDLANTLGPQAAEQARAAVMRDLAEQRQLAEEYLGRSRAEVESRTRQRLDTEQLIRAFIRDRAPEVDLLNVSFNPRGAPHVTVSGITSERAARLGAELGELLGVPGPISVYLDPDSD
jgi:hypothetical protein